MSGESGFIPLTPVPSPLPGARGAIAFKGQISGWKAGATEAVVCGSCRQAAGLSGRTATLHF